MGETKTPVPPMIEMGPVFGPQAFAEEPTETDTTEWGRHKYYFNSHGLSENDAAYQTIALTLSGEAPVRLRALGRIRAAYQNHTIPPFIVKQAIQDAAGTELESDPDLVQRFRFVTDFFFGPRNEAQGSQPRDLQFPLTDWMDGANCLGTDHQGQELFFPDRGESTDRQKKVCSACVVVNECLDFALLNNIEDGVWGGTSERQRRQIRRNIKGGLDGARLTEYIVTIRSKGLTAANRALKTVA